MLLTKMFGQAEILKRQVRELEKEESGTAQNIAVAEMEREKRTILAKHALELQGFEQYCVREKAEIKRVQELKMQSLLARQTKLETEIEELTSNPPITLPPVASSLPDLRHPAAMTPRTAQRYSAFKRIEKGPTISVHPLGSVRPFSRRRPRTADSIGKPD
jgi:hypothetical protein